MTNYVSSLVIALHCLLHVSACRDDLNFTIHLGQAYPVQSYPVRPYSGDPVYFGCFLKLNSSTDAAVTVYASPSDNGCTCSLGNHIATTAGPFLQGGTVNCSTNGEIKSLTVRVNATTEMVKWNYMCKADIFIGPHPISNCTSDSIKIYVTEVPKLHFIPEDMTFNENQMVTISCSTNSNSSLNVTLTVGRRMVNESLNNATMRISATRELHNAEVNCSAPGEPRVVPKIATIRVNYIFTEDSMVPYHTANGRHTFDCANFIESYPGAKYIWFINSTRTMETQSSYTCEEPQWCNTSVTCVATNNVTGVTSNITFIYKQNQTEPSKFGNQSSDKEDSDQIKVETIVVIAVCTSGTVVIAAIVTVLVWKKCICRRYIDQSGRLLCCKEKDEVIDMNDNDLYEAMPMVAAAATSIQPEESLVVASATVAGNLKHKVRSNVYLVLFSDQSCTLTDIQEKIAETVQTRNSLKHVAFLLRCANKRLVLSSSDNVNIDVNSVVSDRRLGDFLKQLVERYMDKSSDELRLDLLNYPDLGASRRAKVVKKLTSLLGIPVFLSHDMYGVTTAIDDRRCAADVYFNRRHIENQVIYTEVDLSKDSRRFPADSHEKVVYSEVLRPPRRPPRSTSH